MPTYNVNLVQLINFAAVINGLMFGMFVLRKKENRMANRFLSVMLLSVSFTLAIGLILEFNLYNAYPWLHWLPFTLTYWIGPAFYFYIKHLIDPTFEFNKSHWWHFSFVILNYTHSVYHLVFGRTFPYPKFHNFTEAVGSYALIPLLIYLIYAHRGVLIYQRSIQHQLSTTDDLELNWIKWFVRIFAGFFAVLALFKLVDFRELIDYTVESSEGMLYQYRDLMYLVMGVSIFWMAFAGFSQAQTINESNQYAESHQVDHGRVVEKLTEAMDERKLYLDSSLDLRTLSAKTHLSEKEISSALNQHLMKNFYYFINEYRVEEVKQRLEDSRYDHLKILSIAFDSGFNSKATFNRFFKKLTGKSPREFRPNS